MHLGVLAAIAANTPKAEGWFSAIMAATLVFAAPSFAEDVHGPAYVVDGDTLDVGETRIRLHGIDAPESGQQCKGGQGSAEWPGKMAAKVLEGLSAGGVSCSGNEHDPYGRLIAVCLNAKGKDINRQLVEAGWAWAFVKYSGDYVRQEAEAKASKRGVWSMGCSAPWDFRKSRWDAEASSAPDNCPIKGNISKNGRIYHMPWGRDYAKTKIDISKGERWFCSEDQAIANGWRAPQY